MYNSYIRSILNHVKFAPDTGSGGSDPAAEPAEPGTDPAAEPVEPGTDPDPGGQKFFTQQDIDKIISERLAREKKASEAEIEKRERLAKMTAEERAGEELKERLAELEGYKAKAEHADAVKKASKTLTEYGIPVAFAEYVADKDEEVTMLNVKEFKTVWDAEKQAAVKAALAGSTPGKPGQVKTKETDSFMEEFKKY
ncbi:DUF4355 domain-containing protein [Listeria monocytogenes]|uniref:DUF4355 domain-containing protein n=1 Tax=Listeria monocytogenes TaxID=1639 RepID=UPI0011EF2576|nr:DUF4355 domain-containing protein [Listeria monocytogenes]TYU32099.1 DUF4355 domain-containing protein [Listeria monocytogenes]